MSYTEQHTGKLKKLNLKDYQAKMEFLISKDTSGLYEDGMTLGVLFNNLKYKTDEIEKYHLIDGELYKLVECKEFEYSDYLSVFNKNSDGTIDFTVRFYNGDTYLDEMIEEGISELNKK